MQTAKLALAFGLHERGDERGPVLLAASVTLLEVVVAGLGFYAGVGVVFLLVVTLDHRPRYLVGKDFGFEEVALVDG